MKKNEIKRFFYLYKYFTFLALFLCYKSTLIKEEMYNNYSDLKSFAESQSLKEESTAKPLTLMTDEVGLFQKFIVATINDDTPADPNCIHSLSEKFKRYPLLTLKFIQDSSHSLSKLGSYQDCIYKIYYNSTDNTTTENFNYSYILFYSAASPVNKRPTLFSVCIPSTSDCQSEDYQYLLETFNEKTYFFDSTQIAEVKAYILNDENKIKNNELYIGLIIIGIFGLLLLGEIFPSIPVCLFKCCFKKKFLKNKLENSNQRRKYEAYEIRNLSKLEKSFDLRDSIGEIMGVESNAGINNDSGLSFLKGLRGICLMLFILGGSLEAIYQYPVKKSEQTYFNKYSLSFLYFFNRFSKNFFLSISTFSLCYKILCYFDNEIEQNELKSLDIKIENINPELISDIKEEEEEDHLNEISTKKSKKHSKKKSPNTSKKTKNSESLSGSNSKKNTSSSGSFSSLENLTKSKKSTSGDLSQFPTLSKVNAYITDKTRLYSKLSFTSFFLFIFRQFYKYLLFVAIILILRYFYYDFVSYMGEYPMWEFIKNFYVNQLTKNHMLSIVFLYLPFYPQINKGIHYEPYDIIILEISLFIICSLILFAIYKTNFRLDILLIIMFSVGIGIKIGAYFIILSRDDSVFTEYFYPSKGFTNNDWKFILNNPFYYIPSLSIGLFFGLLNYAIQKSADKIENFKNKIYLTIPIKFINQIKKRAYLFCFLFSIIFIVLFIWCGMSFNSMFLSEENLNEDSLAKTFFENTFINIYYSVDLDILIFILFLALIPFNLIGENVFISFLKHEYWNILSRPYYSFMLIVQVTGTNIIYSMNTNVELNIYCVLFFGIINFIFAIVLGSFLYTFFEVPLKKLNKFILSRKDDNDNDEADIDEEGGDINIGPFAEGRVSDTDL